MSLLRQALLSLVLIGGALALWVAYVPAALPLLDRVGLLGVIGIEPPAPEAEPAGGGPRGPGGPARVVTASVEERASEGRVRAIGDGRAARSVTVRSEAVGLVTALDMAPGARVEAGDVIARLDDEAETIALERARLVLEDAREDDARISQLRGTGSVTQVRLREAELALRTAELAEREARLDLERRRVLAPISGHVGILDVEVGERVAAQEILATITDRSSIVIDFRVPERAIGQVVLGMPVEISPLGLGGEPLEGEVVAIDTVVDRASRTLRVQASVGNEADALRAGMAFSVALSLPGETYPAIDPLALQWSGEGAYVWAVREGRAERVPVAIRQRGSEAILVEADLVPGEPVVTEGVQTLREGAEVAPVIEGEGAARAPAPAAAAARL